MNTEIGQLQMQLEFYFISVEIQFQTTNQKVIIITLYRTSKIVLCAIPSKSYCLCSERLYRS